MSKMTPTTAASTAAVRFEQERSLWVSAAVADAIARDPDRCLAIACDNLSRMFAAHPRSAEYLEAWRVLLVHGADACIRVLVSETADAAEMRANSPFAGVLAQEDVESVVRRHHAHRRPS
jgi:hypothetical protein